MSEQLARLRADTDAFGHEMLAYYLDPHGEHKEIIEREDGFIDVSLGAPFYFSDYADWPEYERLALAEMLPGRSLDLGCGAGRVELYLQSLGREVVGVDNSPLAVEVCRKRGVLDARAIPVEKITLALGKFDNILMLGNNWGLMSSEKKARALLRRFARMTSPAARIIAESSDIYNTSSPIHLAYQEWNRERGRMPGQIRMRVRSGIHCTGWFDYLMVSPDEMKTILAGTGWKVRQIIPSLRAQYAAVIEKE